MSKRLSSLIQLNAATFYIKCIQYGLVYALNIIIDFGLLLFGVSQIVFVPLIHIVAIIFI